MKTPSACLTFLKQGRKDSHYFVNSLLKYYFGSLDIKETSTYLKAPHVNLNPKGGFLTTQ